MKNKLEMARELEAKAKEFRRQHEQKEKKNRQKMSDKILKILEKVVGHNLSENDVEKIQNFFENEGKLSIQNALKCSEICQTNSEQKTASPYPFPQERNTPSESAEVCE